MAGRGNSKVVRIKEPIAHFVVPYKKGTYDHDVEVDLTEDGVILFKFKNNEISFTFDNLSSLIELSKEEL